MSFKTFLIACGVLLFMGLTAHADDIVMLDKVDIEYFSYSSGSTDPLISYDGVSKGLGNSLNLKLDTTILSYLYLNSRVLGESDNSQYRSIGLEMALGARLTSWLDLGYYHFSRHLLDTPIAYGQAFERMDALAITIKLYDAHKTHDPLW